MKMLDNINNNTDELLLSNTKFKNIYNENIDFLNEGKKEIFKNSQEKISLIDDNLFQFSKIAENCDKNNFLNICSKTLDLQFT